MSQNNYSGNGVKISKTAISVGDEVTLTYNGELVSRGANSVIAHLGYGDNWEEIRDLQMEAEGNGVFKTKLKITMPGSLNVCFKDSLEMWDNNSGNNYSFLVENQKKVSPSKTLQATKESNENPPADAVMKASKETKATKTTKTVKSEATAQTSKTTTQPKTSKATAKKSTK